MAAAATLTTASCRSDDPLARNDACPTCREPLRALAFMVPVALRQQSCIVCRISGEIMNDTNAPLVLPNGNVYSSAALHAEAEANDGRVRDPATGELYSIDDCRKIYIM